MNRSIVSRLVFTLSIAVSIMFLCPAMRLTPLSYTAAAQSSQSPTLVQMGVFGTPSGGGWISYPNSVCFGVFHLFVADQNGNPTEFAPTTLPDGTYTFNLFATDGVGQGDYIRLELSFNTCCNTDIRVFTNPPGPDPNLPPNDTFIFGNKVVKVTNFTFNNRTQPDRVAVCFPSPDGYPDSTGQFTLEVTTVGVQNVPPVAGNINAPLNPVQVNTAITASANFTDQNMGDTHSAAWNWGDNITTPGTVTEADGSGSVSDTHTYTTPGVYTVTLTVTDSGGLYGSSTLQYVVVYDPNGGFVTGGGWINSPAGASAQYPDATGKATFGFVSKYQNGATVPTGNTEFQFKAGNLNFKSTSYDWLVISGAKAQYKGSGTINGTGNYNFMLTAIDGQINGGGGIDKFRIKIFNDTGVVYDNQMNAGDNADPTTALGGGSIVIHKQ